jgi:hypothetical protein
MSPRTVASSLSPYPKPEDPWLQGESSKEGSRHASAGAEKAAVPLR